MSVKGNIQCDYSAFSTSLSPSEVANANLIYNLSENLPETDGSDDSLVTAENNSLPRIPPPKDKFNFVYITFGLLGVGTVLPWNFFITAHDYWMYKFRNVTNRLSHDPVTDRTPLQAEFTSYIALSFMIPYVIFLIISMFLHSRISDLRYVVSSLMLMIIVFIGITAMVKIDSDGWQMSFFALTIFLVVLNGVFSAVLQTASVGISSMLPPRYIIVTVLCQALAGIIATVAQIASLIGKSNPVNSAFGYFLCADFILIATLVAYMGINQTTFFKYYMQSSKEVKPMKEVSSADIKINVPITSMIKWVWPYAATVLMTFWVTLGIFPGLAVLVVSEHASDNSIWTGRLFLPLSCFTLFNIGDFLGRLLGGWLKCDPHSGKYRLLLVSLLRIAFIPLFLLCNAHPRSHLPVVFGDIGYVVLISALGLSNGTLVTLAMVTGTKCFSIEMQETAGVVLSAFLGMGLMVGSLSSYLLIQCL